MAGFSRDGTHSGDEVAVAWSLAGGEICAAPPAAYGPAQKLQVGDRGEMLRATFAAELPEYTATRVIGDDGDPIPWSEDNAAVSMGLGLRLGQTVSDPTRIDTLARAQAIADHHETLSREPARLSMNEPPFGLGGAP